MISAKTSHRVMVRTLRRACPPHTRIVRKSNSATPPGSTTASPVAGSSNASNYSHSSTSPSSSHASTTSSSHYGVAGSSYTIANSQIRSFHSNARYLYATKDTQDKDSLNPQSTEYSKSGSDDAAAHDDAAFDPNQTSPETEAKNMGESETPGEGDPLSVSPGNPQVSKSRDPQEGGAENATGENRSRTSGAGSPNKNSGDKSG